MPVNAVTCQPYFLFFSPVRTRNILDDFREAYYWLRQNTDEHARVMSWWDYGYQIAGMANRTTLVDNNTWNNSHIALVRAAGHLTLITFHLCHHSRLNNVLRVCVPAGGQSHVLQ